MVMNVRIAFLRRITIALVGVSFMLFFLQWMHKQLLPDMAAPLQQVEQLECTFPEDHGAWHQCSLPHNWDVYRSGFGGIGEYRFVIDYQADEGDKAILLAASMAADVYINGVNTGLSQLDKESTPRYWSRYQQFPVVEHQLHQGRNEVLIRVKGYANNSSGLSELLIGPAGAVSQSYQQVMLHANLLTMGALALTILIGLTTGFIGVLGRDWGVAYFSLGSLSSIVYLLDVVMVDIPVSRQVWEIATQSSVIWSEVFFLLFVFYLLDIRHRWLTSGLLAYGVISLLTLAMTSDGQLLPVGAICEGLSLLFLAVPLCICFRRWCEHEEWIALLVGLSLLMVIGCFARDWLPWALGQGVAPPYMFYLGPPSFAIIMSVLLITRLLQTFRTELVATQRMTHSVEKQLKQLEQEHGVLLGRWKALIVRGERDSFARELHDGIGGMLANAMTHDDGQQPRMRRLLRLALGELRMMMSGLDDAANISSMLGAVRGTLQQEADACKIELIWLIADIPADIPDTTDNGLQLVRIVQEAVFNAFRHSGSSSVVVHLTSRSCCISDQGCGFDIHTQASGRGMKNLRWRAHKLGANLEITSDSHGTRIQLSWG